MFQNDWAIWSVYYIPQQEALGSGNETSAIGLRVSFAKSNWEVCCAVKCHYLSFWSRCTIWTLWSIRGWTDSFRLWSSSTIATVYMRVCGLIYSCYCTQWVIWKHTGGEWVVAFAIYHHIQLSPHTDSFNLVLSLSLSLSLSLLHRSRFESFRVCGLPRKPPIWDCFVFHFKPSSRENTREANSHWSAVTLMWNVPFGTELIWVNPRILDSTKYLQSPDCRRELGRYSHNHDKSCVSTL